MSKLKLPMIVLLILQVVAFILYPPAFFQRAPQAAVLPPALFLLFVLALIGVNTSTLTLEGTRSLLIFIQGINIVVRLMMLLPNLKTPAGAWAWGLLVAQLFSMGLSWALMSELERRPLQEMKFRRTEAVAD